MIEVVGDVDWALHAAGIKPVPIGRVALRNLGGVDQGVVARWEAESCTLMPHGGRGVVRALHAHLHQRGLTEWLHEQGEPADERAFERALLDAIARAASPAAIDLLLEQPTRRNNRLPANPAMDRFRHRLIEPPTVAAWGGANIGKSTLLNALAGHHVSIVADVPGTTLDHVGALLNLGGPGGGLVVRYVDTPGIRVEAGEDEREARRLAEDVVRRADLVLWMGDAGTLPPALPSGVGMERVLGVALRSDLGKAAFGHDHAVCAHDGQGMEALAHGICERLVPVAAFTDRSVWRFWEACIPALTG